MARIPVFFPLAMTVGPAIIVAGNSAGWVIRITRLGVVILPGHRVVILRRIGIQIPHQHMLMADIPHVIGSGFLTELRRYERASDRPTQTSGAPNTPDFVMRVAQSHPIGLDERDPILQDKELDGTIAGQIRIRDGDAGDGIAVTTEFKSCHSVSTRVSRSTIGGNAGTNPGIVVGSPVSSSGGPGWSLVP